jgi:GntR family transcriptional regulator
MEQRTRMDPHLASTAPEGRKSQRVYLTIRDEIVSGTRPAGSALPGEIRLAQIFGVSRVTVRRALDVLMEQGLIRRRAGSATTVAPRAAPSETINADIASLMPQLVAMGRDSTARLLSFSYVRAPDPVRLGLGLPDGARVQRAVRVRSANGRVFSHLTTHVPESVASHYSEADLATTPLYRLLERSGVIVENATQTISATHATPDVAEALEIVPGAALIALTRIVCDADGRGVEHLSALYRPDRFRLEMVLNRVGAAGARHWAPVLEETA